MSVSPYEQGHISYTGCLVVSQLYPERKGGYFIPQCRRKEGIYGQLTSSHVDKSICEYTECSTVTGKFCEFPFRYKVRLYDSCITLDGKGSNSEDSWCSTAVDVTTRDHIPGKQDF